MNIFSKIGFVSGVTVWLVINLSVQDIPLERDQHNQ